MNRNVMVVLILGTAAFGYYWWSNHNSTTSTGTDSTVAATMANYTTPADVGAQTVAPTYGIPSSATISYGQSMPLPMTNTLGS
jgi:hypothetical protein